MISAVVKCHLLDHDLQVMTQDALDTIKPYVDELILVDHDSPVGGGWLRSEADIYIRNSKALGFPQTVKQGMGVANNRYVAILNNDIKFFGDWVTPLMEFKDYPLIHPKLIDWGQPLAIGNNVVENMAPQDGMYFSAFIVDKLAYEKLGGWDTDYDFWGYDDWDFYYRFLKGGFKSVWTDKVAYWHKSGATIRRIGKEKYKKKNREIFTQKHGIDPHDIVWEELWT